MKRFLLFVGIVGATVYMLAPPHKAPEGGSEAIQAKQNVSGPLRTSWGSTLRTLREEPATSQDIVSSRQTHTYGSKPRQEAANRYLVVGSSQGDPFERARETLDAYSQATNPSPTARSELWVMGQTNGWVQPKGPNTLERSWASSYVASIEDLGFAKPVAKPVETPSAKVTSTKTKPSHAAKPASRVVATSESQKPDPNRKPAVRVSEDITVAKPHRPRGLFSSNGRRGRGLFGLFRGRNVERRAWSIGPAG
jgi:hypothetical protein